jgi:hypothetical protein
VQRQRGERGENAGGHVVVITHVACAFVLRPPILVPASRMGWNPRERAFVIRQKKRRSNDRREKT